MILSIANGNFAAFYVYFILYHSAVKQLKAAKKLIKLAFLNIRVSVHIATRSFRHAITFIGSSISDIKSVL